MQQTATPFRPSIVRYQRLLTQYYNVLRHNEAPEEAARIFRYHRDHLLSTHAGSPIVDKEAFDYIPYAAYDMDWRLTVPIDYNVPNDILDIPTRDGLARLERIGRVSFDTPHGLSGSLSLFWLRGYSGGVYLPFADDTNGDTTFRGGRVLYDTARGADIGLDDEQLVLDFNFALNPDCAYHPEYTCIPVPEENVLDFRVPIGELVL